VVWVIVVAAVVVIAVVVFATRRRSSSAGPAPAGSVSVEAGDRLRPAVAEFHVVGESARVHFDVPLPDEPDEVLEDLLGREAVEVVREKRHSLPIDDVHQVVALGRRQGEWVVAATISLDTPGELPPPLLPELLPQVAREMDVFDHISSLPQSAPGIDAPTKGEELPSFADEVRLPGAASAALRAQGLDPSTATGPEMALGLMRAGGYVIDQAAADTFHARRDGQMTFVRVVAHAAGSHPELDEHDIRQFVVDFGGSGASRGMLISEKYAPFEIYDRERRDGRVRFVTRERLPGFIDALSMR